ncbi:hypothetical protein AB0L63_25645 [Nocardia sp. NPDC051990]|uniref:hypothetical protein n=1 Tax=Nocardia sp. NPDC051990 TaxID=3155285 RepID=UPI0034149F2F
MAVEIPPEVAEFLDCCGVRYPDIDEGDVRGLAVKVRTFAANAHGPGGDAIAAYERLAATWARSDGDHRAELDRVCAIIANALDAVAYVITVTKAVVLTELAALATTYAAMAATPAARIAGPLVTTAAQRLCAQMERALIGYLVIEVIGRAVEPLGRNLDKLFTGAASVTTPPAERVDEPRMPLAPLAEPRILDVPPAQPQQSGAAPVDPRLCGAAPVDPRLSGAAPVEPQQPGEAPAEPQLSVVPPAEPQLSGAAFDEDVPAVSGVAQGGRVGPHTQASLGPSRSRGFVTPWAHAVRASAQRAASSKTMPAKAFQSLDRRATTARKPRETPWSKLARQSETPSSELAGAATVPTIRRRADGGR